MSCYYCGFAYDNCKCESPQAQVDHLGLKTSKQLAQEHWGGYVGPYTEKLLLATGIYSEKQLKHIMEFQEFCYIATFVHGFKHSEQEFMKVRGMK